MALFLNLVNSSISIKEKPVIIIAGANGSAKKTFAKKYLETVEEYNFYK
jgi:hypothetical protein